MITIVTMVLFIGLMIWGGKLPHKNTAGKIELHSDSTSLEVTKCLRGIAAIGVILHHISQQSAFQYANGWGKPGVLSMFVNAGYYFVAIFFFCSGFGLIKSLNTKADYLNGFIKKRIVKTIVVPFYVNVLIYAVFHLVCGTKLAPGRWICNFLGLTLMNEYAWFPIVLTILYFAFYIIFKHVKNRNLAFFLMFLIIFLQGVFFCFNGHFAWWAGPENWWLGNSSVVPKWWMGDKVIWFFGEWWVNSSIAFLIGMIFAQNESAIRKWFGKLYVLKLILFIFAFIVFSGVSGFCQMKFGYWSEWSGNGPGILNKFICYCAQLPEVISLVIMIFAIMLVYHAENPVTRFMGNISFESYMMNLIVITSFEFLLYNRSLMSQNNPGFIVKPYQYNLIIYEVAVIGVTILSGLLYKWLNKQANKLIK